MGQITKEVLDSIVVLFRRDDSLCLYGIPYRMRPGQQPGDLWRAYRDGRNSRAREGWVWLGSPGWYGHMTPDEQALVRAFLHANKDSVPGGPYEWDYISGKEPGVGEKQEMEMEDWPCGLR